MAQMVQEATGEGRDNISNKIDTLVWWMACLHPDVGQGCWEPDRTWSGQLHSDPITEHHLWRSNSLLREKKRGKMLLKEGQNVTWQWEVGKISAANSHVQTPLNATPHLQNPQDSKQAQPHKPLGYSSNFPVPDD